MLKKILEYPKKICYYSVRKISKGMGFMKGKYSILDIADCFLRIVDRDSGSTITPLKLQKILYYAQGYYLAIHNRPLFNEDFQAWAHGPANPKIYDNYKQYGYNSIGYPSGKAKDVKKEILDFLYSIWETFGIYDGKYLEEMTHSEDPWIDARKKANCQQGDSCTEIITKDSMKEFFQIKVA